MINFVKRSFKTGWQNLCRDRETIFPTIFILLITTLLVSFSIILRDTGEHLIDFIKNKADISVYFKEEVEEEEILKIKEELALNPFVNNVEYVSKDKALQYFTDRYKDNPAYIESLEMVGQNPFLASLNISAKHVEGYELISQFFEKENIKKLINHTSYPKAKIVVDQIFSFISLSVKIALGVLTLFLTFAIFINFNTIKLAILNSCLEIETQRMVGASNWFIRAPFLIQSIIYGVLAGIISLLILNLSCWFLGPKLENFLAGLNLYDVFLKNLWQLILINFGTAVGLALISTFWATRKYLKI